MAPLNRGLSISTGVIRLIDLAKTEPQHIEILRNFAQKLQLELDRAMN